MEKFENPQMQLPMRQNANVRAMPIVSTNSSSSLFLFSSLDSCAIYQHQHYKNRELNPEGMGIPLFHIRSPSFRKESLLVEKYVLLDAKDPPPEAPYKIKKQDGNLILYKVEYCKVYNCRYKNPTTSEVVFSGSLRDVGKYDFVNIWTARGFFGSADGFDLSWRAFDSSVWGEHELFANYADIHRLITHDILPGSRPRNDNGKGGPLSPLGIYLRSWKSSKLNDVCNMLSFLEPGGASSLGIRHVPPVTEFLSIHGILLHGRIIAIIEEERARQRDT